MSLILRGREFRPTLAGLLIAAAACVITVLLGNWQIRRAAEKRLVSAQHDAAMNQPALAMTAAAVATGIDPSGYLGRRIALKGAFDPGFTYFLDNRSRGGKPGYEVLTPIRLKGSDMNILVLRGWLPAGARRDAIPSVTTPDTEVEIEGVTLHALSHALQPPGTLPAGRVRQNLSIAEFARLSGRAMLPFVLEQHTDTADGLDRTWPRKDSGADKNVAYAVQWYCFALLSAILFVVLSFRRKARA